MVPTATTAEHLFVLLFVVVYPVLGYLSFQRLQKRIADGHPADRPKLYRHTLIGHWILLLAGLYLWFRSDRSLAGLGFAVNLTPGFTASVLLAAVGIGVLTRQIGLARRSDRRFLDAVDASFGPIRPLLPRTRGELHGFYAVGTSAGIVEEVLWRGYLLAYLGTWFSTGISAAVVIVAFGLAHAYQGAKSVPKVTLVGAVFTGLYLLSGSIWVPVFLHAAVDVLQGRMAYEVITRRRHDAWSRRDEPGSG